MDNRFSYVYPKDKYFPKAKKKEQQGEKGDTAKPTYTGKTAYLTFDDGPSGHTPQLLDVLERYGIKATFFVIGKDTAFGRSMYKRIADEGHQLGNHSYSHNYSSIYGSTEAFLDDFLRLENLLYSVAGVRPKIIRYPGGSNNTVSHRAGGRGIMSRIVAEMACRGYTHCDWNVDSGDATGALDSPNVIVRNVLSQATGKTNAIVLLHDANYQKHTPNVLPQIIEGLRAQGFAFSVLTGSSFRVQFIKP